MPFKGDLSSFGLADIFQTLAMNRKEGTLVVGDGESRKCIYFAATGVKLLSSGKRRGMRLGEILIKKGKITRAKLEEALALQKTNGQRLGEILKAQNLVTEQEITSFVRAQIEEEIYDLFTWKKAQFEFVEGEPAPDFLDTDKSVTELAFDVNSLLLEAMRRVDEWDLINKAIANWSAVFTVSPGADLAALAKEFESPITAVYPTLQGARSLDDLARDTSLTRFELGKATYDLLQKGIARALTPDEVVAAARQHFQQNKLDEALGLYWAAVDLDANRPDFLGELAACLEKSNDIPTAAEAYARAGRAWTAQNKSAEALDSFERAVALAPGELSYAKSCYQAACQAGQTDRTRKAGVQVLSVSRQQKDVATVESTTEDMLKRFPEDLEVLVKCASAAQDCGDQNLCSRLLDRALERTPKGRGEEVEALCRRLLEVAPGRLDIQSRLQDILDGRVRGKRNRMLALAAAGVVLLGLAAGGWMWRQHAADRGEFDDAAAAAKAAEEQGNFEAAESAWRDFENSHKGSIVVDARIEHDKLSKRRKEAEARTESDQAKTTKALGELLGTAEKHHAAGDPDAARKVFQQAAADAAKSKQADLIARVKTASDRLEAYETAADALAAKSSREVADRKPRDARATARSLSDQYPNSKAAHTLKIPFEIKSIPPNLVVRVDDKEAGRTPLIVSIPLTGKARIALVPPPGFEGKTLAVEGNTADDLSVELPKSPRWQIRVGGSIEAAPVLGSGVVITSNRDGVLRALDLATSSVAWSVKNPATAEILTEPAVRGDWIYVGANDRSLHAIRIEGGKASEVFAVDLGSIVRCSPAAAADGKSVVAAADDGRVAAVDAGEPKVLWRAEVDGTPVDAVVVRGELAFIATARGQLAALKTSDGRPAWTAKLSGAASGRPCVDGESVVVATTTGQMHCFARADGTPRWTRELGNGASTPVVRAGPAYVVGLQTGGIRGISAEDGHPLWQYPVGGALRGVPAVGRGVVYLGGDDGFCYALAPADGQILWRCPAQRRILSGIVAGEKEIAFGTEDGTVFVLDP